MTERLKQLLGFLEETPGDPFLLYAIAAEYAKMGDEGEALSRFVQLTVSHPGYVGTYYHLGKLYEKVSEPSKAIAVYEQGMEVAKNKRDRHALSELQAAWRLANGMDEDDDEYD